MTTTKKLKIRNAFQRERVQTDVSGPSLTKQVYAAECDINNIMRKYERTGLLQHVNQYEGQYGDFTETPASYHEAMNIVVAADEMFQTVPSQIRARFGNDPGAFLAFVDDPANEQEMRNLGLLPPAKPGPAEGGGQPKSVGAMAVDGSETPPSQEQPEGNTT